MRSFGDRFGHRAVVLFLLGLIWVLLAVGLLASEPRRLGLIYEQLPIWVRALVWGVPGLVGMAAAIWRRLDENAWWLLMLPVMERFGSFVWGWIGWRLGDLITWATPIQVDWSSGHVPHAWVGAGIYGAMALLVYECAAGLDRLPGSGEEGWAQKAS